MSTSLVAIVGRPNVGKSTLFNRLVGKRIAIVEDTPGITRDRLYAPCDWQGRSFTVIDTGGIVLDDRDPLTSQVRRQAEIAIEEADVVLFMVDAPEGILDADREIADVLRRAACPILVVANKADNRRIETDAAEFHEFGIGPVYPVSSVHGHGIAELLDATVAALPVEESATEDDETARIAIVGRPNVGKSSLINSLLGADRVIVSDIPGTTRDAIDTLVEHDGQRALLIDTAGIRRAGKIQGSVEFYTVLRARSAIERAHVGVVVIDGNAGLLDGDLRVAGLVHEAGRGCVLAVNKWDLVDPYSDSGRPTRGLIQQMSRELSDRLPFVAYAPHVFCSAVSGLGVLDVLDTALEAAANHAMRIPTGELNRLIHAAIEERPRTHHGRRLRIYYATMARVQPPVIVLFVNDPELVHFSYLRYLENRIREAYPLPGTPLVLRIRRASGALDDEKSRKR
ncbi:MAG: ribosome biogenesis GTPase Der [Chthonomonadales bacterium]|nr:ribosome biogenesis GTPase Der [Chthonomonadales bacterium]